MAAQQCRESRYFHGIICCYIGFAFFSPCKFQTGNPSRRCALQGSLWAGLAACCHAFLARSPDKFGLSRCFPKNGTAEDAIQLSREEVYLLSITMDSVGVWEWDGENKKIVVSKWGSGSTKCLLLNGLDDFVLKHTAQLSFPQNRKRPTTKGQTHSKICLRGKPQLSCQTGSVS